MKNQTKNKMYIDRGIKSDIAMSPKRNRNDLSMNYREAFEEMLKGNSVYRENIYFCLIDDSVYYISDCIGSGKWEHIEAQAGDADSKEAARIFFNAPCGSFYKDFDEFMFSVTGGY